MSGVDGTRFPDPRDQPRIEAKEIAAIAGDKSVDTIHSWCKRGVIRKRIEEKGRAHAWWRTGIYEDLGKIGYGPWAHRYAPTPDVQGEGS